jgi:hypothetical protein
MPTATGVQGIVQQRTSIVIDRLQAARLMKLAAVGDADLVLEVKGRDWRTGAPASAHLTVHEVLVPPDHAEGGLSDP